MRKARFFVPFADAANEREVYMEHTSAPYQHQALLFILVELTRRKYSLFVGRGGEDAVRPL